LRFLWADGAEPESAFLPALRRLAAVARHDLPPAAARRRSALGPAAEARPPARMKGHVDLAHADIPRAVLAEGDVEPRLDGLGAGTGGPFALAVREGRTLVLARDPFGERPLYWCSRGSESWFASHAQELIELKAPLGQIDRGALSDYLELGYVPSPRSMWSNARKVPPGHLLRFKGNGLPEIEPFAEQPLPGMAAKRPSRIAVRARLEAAVKRALHASRSALLEPSLDSAALVALMTRQAGRIRT